MRVYPLKGAHNTKNKFFLFERMFNSKDNGIGFTFLLTLFNKLWAIEKIIQ